MAVTTFAVQYNVTTATASQVSAAFTPAAGDLLFCFVHAQGVTALNTTLTTSKAGETFSLIRTDIHDTVNILALFVADQLTDATSRTVTFNTGGAVPTGLNYTVMRISGMTRVGL